MNKAILTTQSPPGYFAGNGHQASPHCRTTFEPHPRVLAAMPFGAATGHFENHQEDPGYELGLST